MGTLTLTDGGTDMSLHKQWAVFAILVRALTYGTLFVGVVLVYLPGSALEWSGVARPYQFGPWQMAGVVVGTAGAAIALWSILSFILVGRGTPAPFDPPRRLVVRGPYTYVRNPMYCGASLALGGAALYYASGALLAYLVLFILVAHLFVVFYEEPTLARLFDGDYDTYRARVPRWRPTARGL